MLTTGKLMRHVAPLTMMLMMVPVPTLMMMKVALVVSTLVC